MLNADLIAQAALAAVASVAVSALVAAILHRRRRAQPELGVEVQGHRVWIHSMRAVRGDGLDRFMDDAMRLRQLLRKSLERTNGIARKAAGSGPVSRARVPVSA